MKGFDSGEIHPTAIISNTAKFGHNVTIGAHSIVYDNVEMGDNVTIGPNCILGEPNADYYQVKEFENLVLKIGDNALIRSGTILYAGSVIGHDFECGHRVTIREKAEIGANVRIGTLSDIQGYCKIGEYCRLHSNVHIGQKSVIGNYVWIYPYVVLTNDPHPPSNVFVGTTVEDFAVIATQSVVLPGVKIGRDALVGAMSLVRKDVPAETVVVGSPAQEKGSVRDIKSKYTEEFVYPWRERFDRGMPWEDIGYENWLNRTQSD